MNALSLVFRGISVISAIICVFLFLATGNQKEQLKNDLAALQNTEAEAQQNLLLAQNEINDLRRRTSTLDSDLGAEKTRSSTLYQQNVQARTEIKNLRNEVQEMTTTLAELQEDKNRINRELLMVKSEAQQGMDPIKEAEYTGKITALEAEINLLKTQLRQAGQSALTEVTEDFVPEAPQTPAMSGQTFRGKILSINQNATIVAVNLGRNQGADNGSTIEILKDNELLATLQVSSAQENASICRVLPNSPDPRAIINGDDVILVLKR